LDCAHGHKNVRWFDIPMHDPDGMRGVEGVGDLYRQINDLV
jgi:hypothetical protein